MATSSTPEHQHTRLHEAQLLQQLADEEFQCATDAFTALYKMHYRPLLRLAAGCGWAHDVSRAQCEEFVADAMAQLWIQRATPLAPPLGIYLFAIVKRRVLNARRDAFAEERFLPEHYLRCGYIPIRDPYGNLIWSGPPADTHTLRHEVYEAVARSLDRMTPQRRGVLLDQHCDESSVAESAELRGIAQATVKKLRQVGGKALLQAMQQRGHGPP